MRGARVMGWGTLCVLCLLASASAEQRILALAPHAVESLYAVGAGPEIVGTVAFSDHPAAAKTLPRIGDHTKISVEAALRLRPTLVIALDDEVVGVPALRKMGIRVEESHPTTVEEVLEDILHLGSLTGHDEEAHRVVVDLRARLEVLRRARPAVPPKVFYEIWHEPLIAAGGGSFISDALREVGAHNIFAHLPTESPRVSIEAVLRERPDVLIIPSEAREVSERARAWQRLLGGDEVPVVEVAHDLLHRPGPRLVEGMERLQRDLLAVLAPRRSP